MLPSVLFVLGIVAFLAASSIYLTRELLLLRGGALHAYSSKTLAQNDALQGLNEIPPALTEQLIFISGSAKVGAHEMKREIGEIYNLSPEAILRSSVIDGAKLQSPASFPLFNYKRIFSNLTSCNQINQNSLSLTLGGQKLTPGATYNLSTCISPIVSQSQSSFGANLNFPFDLTLQSAQVIGSLGYAEFLGKLILKGDATIIASGDLYLKSILSDGGGSRKLVLISSSGTINVQFSAPEIKLKLIGKEGVYYPGAASFQPGEFPPFFLVRYILGFNN